MPGDLIGDSHSRDSNDSTSSSSSSQLISTIQSTLNGDKSPDNQSEEFVDCIEDDDVDVDEDNEDDEDDGLDFDPISISINKLQDLSREPEQQFSFPDRNHLNQ